MDIIVKRNLKEYYVILKNKLGIEVAIGYEYLEPLSLNDTLNVSNCNILGGKSYNVISIKNEIVIAKEV